MRKRKRKRKRKSSNINNINNINNNSSKRQSQKLKQRQRQRQIQIQRQRKRQRQRQRQRQKEFRSGQRLTATVFGLLVFGRICARQLLAVETMPPEPFTKIFAQMFGLFPLNEFVNNRLVHAFLPCNSGGRFIDGDFVLLVF